MINFKFQRTITVDYSGDLESVKPKMIKNLNLYFKTEGFFNSMENDELIYKRNFNSASEIVLPSRQDFFKVLTNVRVRLINNGTNNIKLDFIADLRYLLIFSLAIGLAFSLGFYPLFSVIGSLNYLAIALSISIISGLIGYLSIRFKIASIIDEVFIG